MAWTLVGQNSHQVPSGGGTQNLTLPGTRQEGDIVIVLGGSDAVELGINTSGYVSLFGLVTTNPENICQYKIMGASPDSVVNITRGSADSAWVIQVWRGVDPSDPIDNGVSTVQGSTGMPNPPSHTTITDGALVFAVGVLDDEDVASGVSAPSLFSQLVAGDTGNTSTSIGATVMLASRELASAGALNPGSFGGSGDDSWVGATFALRPASSGQSGEASLDLSASVFASGLRAVEPAPKVGAIQAVLYD